jgi:hypothetical protein
MSGDSPVAQLLARAKRAELRRMMFQSLMQDVYAYAMPERDAWSAYGYGQDRQTRVYDSTAVVATARFANRLQSALFPPQQRWAQLALPPELADRDGAQELQVDMEAATDLLFRHVHASNFDQAANEWAQDLAAGVACMLVEDGRFAQRRARGPRLRFQAVPAALVAFDDGPHGHAEGVFFTQKIPARLLARTYPDARNVPADVQRMAASAEDHEITLLQATTYDPDSHDWHFRVLLPNSETVLVDRRYRTSPWIITRWTRAPGETHGRGPLTQALPDIRTLNKLTELMLKAASLSVGGAWTVLDDGVVNPDTIRIEPGAMIPVRSNGGNLGPSLKPLEFPGSFQLDQVLAEQLRTRIRQVLFDDPLPPEVRPGVTATEVSERMRRFDADTGSFGRLQAEAVTPLLARIIDILDQAGEFATPRFAGIMDAVQNDAVRIVATSPLSLAQERADVQAVLGTVATLTQLGEPGMAMLRNAVALDRAGATIAAKGGVPQHLIPTRKELAAQAKAAAQAQNAELLANSPVAAQVAGAAATAALRPQPEPPA